MCAEELRVVNVPVATRRETISGGREGVRGVRVSQSYQLRDLPNRIVPYQEFGLLDQLTSVGVYHMFAYYETIKPIAPGNRLFESRRGTKTL